MTIKFEKIQPGMTLYGKTAYRNNARRTVHIYQEVRVVSVNSDARSCVVSINARTETWNERRMTRLSAKKPAEKKAALQ